ncbi:MAG TPA: hypothetical protein VMH86_16245 [Rhizomicrobium sp.]|nr:hypothetical protein [Rhizomicrobium sp.]
MGGFGARVYGLGAAMMGGATLVWGDFAEGWIPPPPALPGRAALAYAVGALMLAGGVLVNVRRNWGAALLTAGFGAGLVLLDLTRLTVHPLGFDYWESSAEQVALTVAGLIVLAPAGGPLASARLAAGARFVFGLCVLIFGTAHFVFAKFSATFVPSWIPPGAMFWVYFTGAAAIAAGLAILSGVLDLLAARLLTLMYVLFGILVHTPVVMSAHPTHGNWIEFMVNLALAGAAWIVADSLAARKAATASPP